MTDNEQGYKDQNQQTPGRWQRVISFATSLALLFAIIGGVAVAGGGLIYLWVEELRSFSSVVFGVGLVLLLIALVVSFPAVYAVVAGVKGRYTLTAIATVSVFLLVIVLVNFISSQNVQRFDTTFTRQFTLSSRTVGILDGLTEPVKITGFFVPSRREHVILQQQADSFLFEFQRRSDRRVTYKFVDPESEPSIARRYNVNQYPTLVFETVESKRQYAFGLPPVSEQSLVSALLIVTGEQRKKIYFLTGHKEKDLIDSTETSTMGYGFALRGILSDNYEVEALNLGEARYGGKIPDDVAVLVIPGATNELLTDEMIEIREWLKRGGRALFLVDPGAPNTIVAILEKWGILVGKDTLVDPLRSITGDPRTPMFQRTSFLPSPITDQLDVVFFPQATPVKIRPDYMEDPRKIPPWIQFAPFIETSIASWSTLEPERNQFSEFDDSVGPHWVGLAVQALSTVEEEPDSSDLLSTPAVTSIVVLGDSDFATNRYYSAYTNSDLLLNSINWLAKDFTLISIRPKPFSFRDLVVLPYEFDMIRYSSWFVLPIAVAFMGLIIWWRRR